MCTQVCISHYTTHEKKNECPCLQEIAICLLKQDKHKNDQVIHAEALNYKMQTVSTVKI